MVAVASILYAVETYVPTPTPWIRLGLANVVTILALRWWGLKEAVGIVLLRVVLGGLLIGRFLHPVFIISLTGGLAATLVMYGLMRFGGRFFSLIGVSIGGALVKNAIQLLIASVVYIQQIRIIYLLPLFFFSSLAAGLVVGIISSLLHRRIKMDSVGFACT
jgi:heptaprenyl diphosphate synthase